MVFTVQIEENQCVCANCARSNEKKCTLLQRNSEYEKEFAWEEMLNTRDVQKRFSGLIKVAARIEPCIKPKCFKTWRIIFTLGIFLQKSVFMDQTEILDTVKV